MLPKLEELIAVARGDAPADTVLRGGAVFDETGTGKFRPHPRRHR